MMIFKREFRLDEQNSPQNNTKNNASFCGIFVEYLLNFKSIELLTFLNANNLMFFLTIILFHHIFDDKFAKK